MNNLQKALEWRLYKLAAAGGQNPPQDPSKLIEAAKVGAVLGIPWVAGNAAGRLYSRITAPKAQDLDRIQAKYVTTKLEQAIENLEQKKKMQALKESLNGNASTLRI